MLDDLQQLISEGESERVEFKSSLRWDVEEQRINKALPKKVAIAIAGFLNNRGGQLVIGVADDGTVVGIEQDIPDPKTKSVIDVFDRTLRQAVGKYLQVETSSQLSVKYVPTNGRTVSLIECPRSQTPIFLADRERTDFYVRDGMATRKLTVKEAHEYIAKQFDSSASDSSSELETLLAEAVSELRNYRQAIPDRALPPARLWVNRVLAFFNRETARDTYEQESDVLAQDIPTQHTESDTQDPKSGTGTGKLPPWLTVHTRNVLNAFLKTLRKAPGWKTLYIVSPWLSSFGSSAAMSLEQIARRAEEHNATIYLVTRPPENEWHQEAIDILTATSRTNVALVPELHAKLFAADAREGAFALLGSANFTANSENNLEIGLLVNSYQEGKRVIKVLRREAASIYRTPGRQLIHRSRL